MKKGHIFAGLWLEDMTFPEAVQDDPALLRKKLADGVNEIAVVECTLMNAGKGASFDDASQAAVKEVPEALCIIDVKRSRYSGIKPLPVRVMTDSGWTVQRDGKEDDEITGIPKELDSVISIDESKTALLTKLQQWERKLLDLGLRNSLINFRMSKTTVPLIISSVDDLEDALADGEDFIVMPRPEELKLSGNIGFESIDDIGECSEIIKSEFKNHRLRSLFSETELANTIKETFRDQDIIFRLGGDEFAVFVPNITNEDLALGVINRFINKLKEIKIKSAKSESVYASIGAGIIPEGFKINFEKLYRLVDTGVYKSKNVKGQSSVTFVELR